MNELTIATQIKALRERCGITSKELAEKAGTTHANVCNIENGKRPQTTYMMVERILNAMGYELTITPRL